MAAYEQDVTSHYNLSTPFPEEWPAELDESDGEAENNAKANLAGPRRSKSRYSALSGRNSVRRSQLIGSPRVGDSRDILAQKDEPDPLGSTDSVLRTLRQRGLAVEDDARMRNRFLLSSTTFSPALFLAQTHSDASTRSLLQGLDYLSRSIDQKSASLKVLVESNFERFVRAKATIDNVYTEMRNQGVEQDQDMQVRRHSRHRSRGHLRNLSSSRTPSPSLPPPVNAPHKHALMKESEYGVLGIRAPLLEAAVKAEEVWGPALGGREREQGLKTVMTALEKHRNIYEIGANLTKHIRQRDYETVVEEYNQARTYATDSKFIADKVASTRSELTDDEAHTILVTGRMWVDVEEQIQALKRELWRRLGTVETNAQSLTATGPVEEHMELIGTLLELGVEDNPVSYWLLGRYSFLKAKITAFCDRSQAEMEILRRRLALAEKATPQVTSTYLRLPTREASTNVQGPLDTEGVMELWECIQTFLTKLLSLQKGLLGEVVDFWDAAQSFIDGSKQKLLPAGYQGESRKHHSLSPEGVQELKDGVIEIVNVIRQSVLSLFNEPPIEDISRVFSPMTPSTPLTGLTPTESRFKLDPTNLPPPSPRTGEPWEEYAFWPPNANSLSGVHYLSKFLILIGTAASEMAALQPIKNGGGAHDPLKALVSICRERSVRMACAAWNKNAENCKYLEDWTRDSDRKDLTKMPGLFMAFENAVLAEMQKMLYLSDAMSKSGNSDVVTPPPPKLLQLVRANFVGSIYKALSGLVENAEIPAKAEEDEEWIRVGRTIAMGGSDTTSSMIVTDGIDAKNTNVRMLLTLSNLKALRADLVPQLVSNFESAFSVKLTEESKTVRDVLGQIDTRLFTSYTKPVVESLNTTIWNGITDPGWVPTGNRPDQVRPYVYSTMLTLVLVHTEVSTTIPTPPPTSLSSPTTSPNAPSAGPPLTTAILTHLLVQISSSLLSAFSSRPKYTLPALMQATLDTEFIAQTMSQYSSEEAGSTQSKIYLELDRRTSNEARTKLQAELGEMRGVLKRLRESTKGEFACFKKPRSGTAPKS